MADQRPLEAKFVSMTTAEDLVLYCSEVYLDHLYHSSTEWTVNPVKAIREGEELVERIRSHILASEAHSEAMRLFAAA